LTYDVNPTEEQKKSLMIPNSSSKAPNSRTDDAMATGKRTTSWLASFIYVLVPNN
jgi:hypothetical protein